MIRMNNNHRWLPLLCADVIPALKKLEIQLFPFEYGSLSLKSVANVFPLPSTTVSLSTSSSSCSSFVPTDQILPSPPCFAFLHSLVLRGKLPLGQDDLSFFTLFPQLKSLHLSSAVQLSNAKTCMTLFSCPLSFRLESLSVHGGKIHSFPSSTQQISCSMAGLKRLKWSGVQFGWRKQAQKLFNFFQFVGLLQECEHICVIADLKRRKSNLVFKQSDWSQVRLPASLTSIRLLLGVDMKGDHSHDREAIWLPSEHLYPLFVTISQLPRLHHLYLRAEMSKDRVNCLEPLLLGNIKNTLQSFAFHSSCNLKYSSSWIDESVLWFYHRLLGLHKLDLRNVKMSKIPYDLFFEESEQSFITNYLSHSEWLNHRIRVCRFPHLREVILKFSFVSALYFSAYLSQCIPTLQTIHLVLNDEDVVPNGFDNLKIGKYDDAFIVLISHGIQLNVSEHVEYGNGNRKNNTLNFITLLEQEIFQRISQLKSQLQSGNASSTQNLVVTSNIHLKSDEYACGKDLYKTAANATNKRIADPYLVFRSLNSKSGDADVEKYASEGELRQAMFKYIFPENQNKHNEEEEENSERQSCDNIRFEPLAALLQRAMSKSREFISRNDYGWRWVAIVKGGDVIASEKEYY